MDVKWPECLSIPIVWDQISDEAWDSKLEEHYSDEERYDFRAKYYLDSYLYYYAACLTTERTSPSTTIATVLSFATWS